MNEVTAKLEIPHVAFVIPVGNGKFTCLIDKMGMGTSKHHDYFEYHYKRKDIKRLTGIEIGQFVYTDNTGKIESVSTAEGPVNPGRGVSQQAAAAFKLANHEVA